MRSRFAVGVILVFGGVSILFLGVLIPRVTQTTANWETEHETVPIEVTILAFVFLICGLGLVAVELATSGVVYSRKRKKNQDAHNIEACLRAFHNNIHTEPRCMHLQNIATSLFYIYTRNS